MQMTYSDRGKEDNAKSAESGAVSPNRGWMSRDPSVTIASENTPDPDEQTHTWPTMWNITAIPLPQNKPEP